MARAYTRGTAWSKDTYSVERLGRVQAQILVGLRQHGQYTGVTKGSMPLYRCIEVALPPEFSQEPMKKVHRAALTVAAKELKAKGLIWWRAVKDHGCSARRFKLTKKGLEYLRDRRERYENVTPGEVRWRTTQAAKGRLRWDSQELLDAGWKGLIEYSTEWQWRYKLTNPKGKESSWQYCLGQSLREAKQEATAAWLKYRK